MKSLVPNQGTRSNAGSIPQPELLTPYHGANFLLPQLHSFQIPEAEFLITMVN